MPLTDPAWTAVAADLRRALTRAVPGWADRPPGDPGVTVLEAFAYALEQLRHQQAVLDPAARRVARRLSELAAELALPPPPGGAAGPDDCGPGLRRVRYAEGRLLTAQDLQDEQAYWRERLARRNRWQAGIVGGLGVTLGADADGAGLTIAPGLAIDPQGREIAIDADHRVALPALAAPGAASVLVVRYAERPCAFVVPGPTGAADAPDDPAPEPSRVVEGFEAALVASADADSVPLARVVASRGRWRLEPRRQP